MQGVLVAYPIYITLQDLLRKMKEESKVLVQNFQEKCATKIANREIAIFGSVELEKGIVSSLDI